MQTTTTDADGRATFKAFPMNYMYIVTAKGFQSESGRIELKRDTTEQEPQEVKLYPAISATIRFAWTTTSLQGGETTSNETTIEVGEGVPPMPFSPDTMHLLRPIQVGNKLTLQSGPAFWGGAMIVASPWVRRAPTNLVGDQPLKFFTAVDLQKLDAVKDEWETIEMVGDSVRRSPHPPLAFEVKHGDIFAGQMPVRDMRNGQPTRVSFKAFVEKVSKTGEAE